MAFKKAKSKPNLVTVRLSPTNPAYLSAEAMKLIRDVSTGDYVDISIEESTGLILMVPVKSGSTKLSSANSGGGSYFSCRPLINEMNVGRPTTFYGEWSDENEGIVFKREGRK